MKSNKKAYLFALLAILSWSTIASAFKITLSQLDFLNTLFYSASTSTMVLLVLIFIKGKQKLLKGIKRKDFLNGLIRGSLNPFLYYIVLLRAYELLRAQEAGTLNYIWPITLVLFSVPLLKQKIGWLSILAIFISFCGIVVISTEGRISSFELREPLGVLLAVGSSVFWALYWILNLRDKQDTVIKLFLNFCFGTILILGLLLINGTLQIPNWRGLAGSVYIGIFEMGLTFFLWMNGLKYADNTARVSNLVYLSPFISLVIIQITIGEKILTATILGLTLIVSGILIQHFSSRKKLVIRK